MRGKEIETCGLYIQQVGNTGTKPITKTFLSTNWQKTPLGKINR